jgi:molecular chaperone HscB
MQKAIVVVESPSMSNQTLNPFELLGLEPTFDVVPTLLDKAYFSRQTLSHPDRFIYHTEPERLAASNQASALNHAYETLKNPALRAKALLKLRGIDFGDDPSKTVQDPIILEEMMDLQEKIEEAASPDDFKRIESQIQERLKDVMTAFSSSLQKDQDKDLLRGYLTLTYLSKMIGDLKTRQRQSSVKVL